MKLFWVTFFFAFGTWTTMNFLWAEMPLLVAHLPEQWSLPSILAMITAVGNLVPFTLALIKWRRKDLQIDVPVIAFGLLLSILSCIALWIVWRQTILINHQFYSVPLYFVLFFISACACLTNVTFLPYIQHLPGVDLNYFFIGQSFSSLVPAVFTAIQGISKTEAICSGNTKNASIVTDENPSVIVKPVRLPFESGVGLCIFMISLSLLSFIYMERIKRKRDKSKPVIVSTILPKENVPNATKEDDIEVRTDLLVQSHSVTDENGKIGESTGATVDKQSPLSVNKVEVAILYAVMFFIGIFLFGILLGIGSYSFLPYGQSTYFWASILNMIAVPIACLLPFIFPRVRYSVVLLLSSLGFISAIYVFIMAFQSPCSFLHDHFLGGILVVILSFLAFFLLIFARNVIAALLRTTEYIRDSLFWLGIVQQLGSLIGALSLLLLVNVFHVLKSRDPCDENICRR